MSFWKFENQLKLSFYFQELRVLAKRAKPTESQTESTSKSKQSDSGSETSESDDDVSWVFEISLSLNYLHYCECFITLSHEKRSGLWGVPVFLFKG